MLGVLLSLKMVGAATIHTLFLSCKLSHFPSPSYTHHFIFIFCCCCCCTGSIKPVNTTYTIGPKHDGEGRVIVLEYPLFYFLNLYVPNAGGVSDFAIKTRNTHTHTHTTYTEIQIALFLLSHPPQEWASSVFNTASKSGTETLPSSSKAWTPRSP